MNKDKLYLLKCNICKRKFPYHLVNMLYTSEGYTYACPICALKQTNKLHGLPENTPFQGEMAREYYEEAINYLKQKEGGVR